MLDRWNEFERYFYPKVTAGGHDAVSLDAQRIEMLEDLRAFHLGEELHVVACKRAQVDDVLRRLHERQRDPVCSSGAGRPDVELVFWCDRRRCDAGVREIDTLLARDVSANDNPGTYD